jgi:hypothetical protein
MPVAAPASAPVVLAPVVDDHVRFLETGRAAPVGRSRPILVAVGTGDAAIALAHLASHGVVAPAQIDALREGFRAAQTDALRAVLRGAARRALLLPAQCDDAVASFETQCMVVTPRGFLLDAGLLTSDQLQQLTGRATPRSQELGSIATFLRTKWGRVVIAAAAVCVVGTLGGGFWFLIRPDVGADVKIDATGDGVATFTNRGRGPGSLCGYVRVVCPAGLRESTRFCSGDVAAGASANVPFFVPGMHRIVRARTEDCDLAFMSE